MSKVFQRINTIRETFSYEIHVHYIILSVPKETLLKVVWRKKEFLVETRVITMTPEEKKVEINEQLIMPINTLYKKKATGVYRPKETELKIEGESNGKHFDIGKVILNLADYIESPIRESSYQILKSKDKNAEICLSIKAEHIETHKEAVEMEMENAEKALKQAENLETKIEENHEESKGETDSSLFGNAIGEIQIYKEKLEKNLAKIEEISNENQELRENLKEKEKKEKYNEELEEKLDRTKSKGKELKKKITNLKGGQAELEELIIKEKKEIEKLKEINEEKSKGNKKVSHLESKVLDLEEEISKLKGKTAIKAEIIHSLTTNNNALEEKNQALEKELHRLQNLEEEFNRKKEENEESPEKIEDQINDLNERMKTILRRHTEYRK
ncbi:unnamed protein product [Blepharisma stoltei]|uniref:C2 NT-type domain-containing protein n=1 Tax=Blepharisma stoltei TaxID=1481888 RepID=A0AAU9ID20_9CILI|nr:unnamed protein product [Blepharisma stoltei]